MIDTFDVLQLTVLQAVAAVTTATEVKISPASELQRAALLLPESPQFVITPEDPTSTQRPPWMVGQMLFHC